MKKKKFIGRWVNLYFGDDITRAKIIGIYFHQELKKPVFEMVSSDGNRFRMTREEVEYYECENIY